MGRVAKHLFFGRMHMAIGRRETGQEVEHDSAHAGIGPEDLRDLTCVVLEAIVAVLGLVEDLLGELPVFGREPSCFFYSLLLFRPKLEIVAIGYQEPPEICVGAMLP